jgi:hypothetical protein
VPKVKPQKKEQEDDDDKKDPRLYYKLSANTVRSMVRKRFGSTKDFSRKLMSFNKIAEEFKRKPNTVW